MGNAAEQLEKSKSDAKKIIVEARVREVLADEEGGPFKFSSEFFEALNGRVEALIREAAARAVGNGRVTLQSQDA